MAAKPGKKNFKPSVKPTDALVLRSPFGEQSFTGKELAAAQSIADEYTRRGWRVSLMLYSYRPTARRGLRSGVAILYATGPRQGRGVLPAIAQVA